VAERKSDVVLQAHFLQECDAIILICLGLNGQEVTRLMKRGCDLALEACSQLALQLNTDRKQLRVVLPDGQLLDTVCTANPSVTLAAVCLQHDKA
jgi:hypothetical protein